MPDLYLTVQEVARLEGVSSRHIRREISKYEVKKETGLGGSRYLIAFSSLSEKAQKRYNNEAIREFDPEEIAELPPDKAVRVRQIFDSVVRINKCKVCKKRDRLTQDLAKDLGMSASNLYKLRKAFNESGSVSVFIRTPRSDNGKAKNWDDKALHKLVSEYGQCQNKSIAYDRMVLEASKYGLQIGSFSSACRFLKRIDGNSALSTYIKKGERGLINEIIPSNLRDYASLACNEWLCGDHHIFDLFIYDPIRKKVYRPWMTAWQDMKTRAIPGYCIVQQPNSRSIAQALQHVIQRDGRERHYGIAKHAYIDNGKDYKCKQLAGGSWKLQRYGKVDIDDVTACVLAELGIEPIFAWPFNPQSKPIERFFKTIETQLIEFLPGFCGHNIEERNAHELIKEIGDQKLLTLEEFKVVVGAWIENKYHKNVHRGDGMELRCPDQVWDDYWRDAGGEPVSLDNHKLLYHLFLSRKTGSIGRHGIEFKRNGVKHYYYNEVMMFYVGHKVEVRYDPDNVDEVQVYAWDEKVKRYAYLCPAVPFQKATWGMDKDELALRIADQRHMRKMVVTMYENLVGPKRPNNSRGPGNFHKAIEKYEEAVNVHDALAEMQRIKKPRPQKSFDFNMLPPDDCFN